MVFNDLLEQLEREKIMALIEDGVLNLINVFLLN